MENPVQLSLGRWPTEPLSRNFSASPITLRIIKKVKVQVESILPISFAQFVMENNLINANKGEAEQQYVIEVERRKKQVQILRGIWAKVKQKRSKSAKQSLSAQSSCLVKIRENISKRSTSKSFHSSSKKNKSKSPLIFKAKSPNKGSTYFDYYNTNGHNKIHKKKQYQEQSTQSRREKTFSASRNNDEYFSTHRMSKGRKTGEKEKENLFKAMDKIMKEWGELDEKHRQELEEMRELTERERKRLLKIHQIEKEKIKKQMEHMRSKISSYHKLNKCFS